MLKYQPDNFQLIGYLKQAPNLSVYSDAAT
jgi:hypothetical protein